MCDGWESGEEADEETGWVGLEREGMGGFVVDEIEFGCEELEEMGNLLGVITSAVVL